MDRFLKSQMTETTGKILLKEPALYCQIPDSKTEMDARKVIFIKYI